jgi:hypothetical protein
VTTHHRGILRDEDGGGGEVHRDMLRQYASAVRRKWHWRVVPTRRGGHGHAAGDRPLACTRPRERRPRECVR